MNKVKITIYTGGTDAVALIFEYTYVLWDGAHDARFYRTEHAPTGLDKPTETLRIAPNHSFTVEYLNDTPN